MRQGEWVEVTVTRAASIFAAWIALAPACALAQPAEQFFEGRTIAFTVAFNPGGTYDTYARLATKHLPKHIPGQPAIVVRNMQGANSVRGATHLATQAARDGTAIGMISQQIALKQMLADPAIRFNVGISTGSGASRRRSRPPSSGTPRRAERSRMR